MKSVLTKTVVGLAAIAGFLMHMPQAQANENSPSLLGEFTKQGVVNRVYIEPNALEFYNAVKSSSEGCLMVEPGTSRAYTSYCDSTGTMETRSSKYVAGKLACVYRNLGEDIDYNYEYQAYKNIYVRLGWVKTNGHCDAVGNYK